MRGRGRRRLLRLDPADGAVFRFAVELGVRVAPALGLWLLVFYLGPVGLGPRVVADAGDLPGDLDVRPVGLDGEVAARDLLGDDRLGELTDDRELVAEVAVDRLELGRQLDRGEAAVVGLDVAVVDVHHVGRLDKRAGKVLGGRVERVVDRGGGDGG